MARKPRIYYPGALYHIIMRGNARQDVFVSYEDRNRFLLFMQEGVERYGHRVLAYCLMTNHIHLAIQVADIPLSRIMQNLTFRYTKWLNWRLNRVGHIFQGRYKAILIDVDSYFLELVAYIHLNPVRAGMVAKPEDYEWSSHRAYCGVEKIPWLNQDYLLSLFSADYIHACRLYSDYVLERHSDGHREEFYGKMSLDSRVMGQDSFVEEILSQTGDIQVSKPTVENVIEMVTKIYGLKEEDLASNGQKRLPSEARSMVAWAVIKFTNASLTELAKRMNRDVSTLSAAVRRFELSQSSKPDCAKRLQKLKDELQVAILQA